MMHEEMLEQLAESRGHDKGYSLARSRDHELMNELLEHYKHKRQVAEAEGLTTGVRRFQAKIDAIEHAKLCIRAGEVKHETVE